LEVEQCGRVGALGLFGAANGEHGVWIQCFFLPALTIYLFPGGFIRIPVLQVTCFLCVKNTRH